MALANNVDSFKRQAFKGVFIAKKLLKDWIDGVSIILDKLCLNINKVC